ncbi:MAG: L-2-hydroxyglutarate oxidase [Planctomycetota bacterium]
MTAHVVVIGGGIVGLATARELLERHPRLRVSVLEKEPELALHQTGRNSGVVHSGLYYKPGSLKAETCRRGKRLLEDFCRENGVAHERCGKVVVATREDELPRLANLESRARENGVEFERIGPERLRELEPHAAGISALHVPESGIVNYTGMCAALARQIRAKDGVIQLGMRVERMEVSAHDVMLHLDRGIERAEAVINCAGLQSDLVARRSGADPGARIVPFRGEYFELVPDAQGLVKNLIYPVPDPRFPFLGVHFTRMIAGGIECGPNAVFALAREGYRWRDIDVRDLADALSWPGTWRLFREHWKTGFGETWRSVYKGAFVEALQRLVPEIKGEHLVRAPAGVRAQALTREGGLVDDFALVRQGPIVHVTNAPSPAATASLAIAERLADELAPSLQPHL